MDAHIGVDGPECDTGHCRSGHDPVGRCRAEDPRQRRRRRRGRRGDCDGRGSRKAAARSTYGVTERAGRRPGGEHAGAGVDRAAAVHDGPAGCDGDRIAARIDGRGGELPRVVRRQRGGVRREGDRDGRAGGDGRGAGDGAAGRPHGAVERAGRGTRGEQPGAGVDGTAPCHDRPRRGHRNGIASRVDRGGGELLGAVDRQRHTGRHGDAGDLIGCNRRVDIASRGRRGDDPPSGRKGRGSARVARCMVDNFTQFSRSSVWRA